MSTVDPRSSRRSLFTRRLSPEIAGPARGRDLKDPIIEQEVFDRRAAQAFGLMTLFVLLLLARFAFLQIASYSEYSTQSVNNRVRVQPVTPNRGLIYDRRGRPIADNVPAYRLELVPEDVEDVAATLASLGEFIDLGPDVLERFERSRGRYREFDSVPVKFNLSEEEVARFAVDRHRFEGVDVRPYLARRYPYGELLTHVLGYVGRLDADDLYEVDENDYRGTSHIGKIGIEKFYESQLHGRSGRERVETNAQGRVLQVLERIDPRHGNDLVLSIDVQVQRSAWGALGERPGAVVAIDPMTGAVLAMVSKPSYDANLFVHGIGSADYRAILETPGKPLINRALQGGYEPGSTLKPFVGLAGLELGVIDREEQVYSSGSYELAGAERPFRDWKSGGHGWVDIRGALEQSVNTYFYQLAYDLGIDRMHDYLAQFGFGQPTGVDMPNENTGVLPSRDWKRGRYSEPWYPGETVIAGIGQGFNVTTPVQLAAALATLANGGTRLAPRLLYAEKRPGDERARLVRAPVLGQVPVVDEANWAAVREGMRRVVHGPDGTARGIRPENDEFRIAGKSGTAQVYAHDRNAAEANANVASHLRNHALFVAYAPLETPEIAVAVVIEHGGGGSSEAAPIARAVIDSWLVQEGL
jgi:penicillin-binding protein 2